MYFWHLIFENCIILFYNDRNFINPNNIHRIQRFSIGPCVSYLLPCDVVDVRKRGSACKRQVKYVSQKCYLYEK